MTSLEPFSRTQCTSVFRLGHPWSCRYVMIWSVFLTLWWANRGNFVHWFGSYAIHTPKMLLPCSSFSWFMLFSFSCIFQSIRKETSLVLKTFLRTKIGHQLYHVSLPTSGPRCVPALESAIREVDQAYDSCNEAWARGEADKFHSSTLLIWGLVSVNRNRNIY